MSIKNDLRDKILALTEGQVEAIEEIVNLLLWPQEEDTDFWSDFSDRKDEIEYKLVVMDRLDELEYKLDKILHILKK